MGNGKPLGLVTADNRRAQLAGQIREHARICRTCQPLTRTRSQWCDDGWALERAYRAADNEVTASSGPAPDATGELF